MIRFCDKEICCITEADLDRQQIMSWFFDGHREEPVCVIDKTGAFMGMITYESLLGNDMEDAIKRDYVVLDEEIWERGRRYFRKKGRCFAGAEKLLPVLNRAHELVCFAWQDEEANRELRMLDELSEREMPVGFREVFPEYDSVTIYGCNELAYFFACYLRENHIPVRTVGTIWELLDAEKKLSDGDEGLDYRNYNVCAEGMNELTEDIAWRESVSAEFECIDRIYEENILRGVINDAKGCFADMIERWKEKCLYIIGTGEPACNAYDLLLGYGLDVEGFISEEADLRGRTFLGRKIYSFLELPENPENVLLLEPTAKDSAWGFGGTDFYHYWGYKRNEAFCLLEDYTEIPKNGLINLLSHRVRQSGGRIVLMGEYRLCLKLGKVFKERRKDFDGRMAYCDLLEEYGDEDRMDCITVQEVSEEDQCLLLLPDYYGYADTDLYRDGFKPVVEKQYRKALEKFQIKNIMDYLLYPSVFGAEEKTSEDKNRILCGNILLGVSDYFSGNTFLDEVLCGHPDIIALPYGYLKDNLFAICTRLSVEKSENIMPLFWKMYSEPFEQERKIYDKDTFGRVMGEMLSEREYVTSQELFVMIHVSFACMKGRKINDVSKMTIFWEPHEVDREMLEEYAVWLKLAAMRRYIVKMVRNAYMRAGSFLRWRSRLEKRHDMMEKGGQSFLWEVVKIPEDREKEYEGWERIAIKFEDLKCHPKEELRNFCVQTKIAWSDKLLGTDDVNKTYHGISGFDLLPVYRTYEEYFTAFDKFRMTLMAASWQRKYGYSYVSGLEFSRKELLELFLKKYKFEDSLVFDSEGERRRYMIWRSAYIRKLLWKNRREEVIRGNQKERIGNDSIL